MKKSRIFANIESILSLSFTALMLTSCVDFDVKGLTAFEDLGLIPPLFEGNLEGDGCSQSVACRKGLVCVDEAGSGVCRPSQTAQIDEACLRSDECADGLRCSWSGFCVQAGEKELNQSCGYNAECQKGLICKNTGGLAGQCTDDTGTKEVETPCESNLECADGLICSAEQKQCLPGSLLLNPETFRGVVCHEDKEAQMPFQPLFEAPSDASALANKPFDFYALPFPNDLRILKSISKVDLSDYPRPGAGLNEKDLFADLLDVLSKENSAFSLNPGIFMRFNREIDANKIQKWVEDGVIRLVDLDRNEIHPITASFHHDRNKYICGDYLYVHPVWSKPLKPATTYALIITGALRSVNNETAIQSAFLSELLKDQIPSDPLLKDAWNRYKKLRDWQKNSDLQSLDIVVGATVFTTRAESEIFSKAKDVIDAGEIPNSITSSITLCKAGVKSPCANPNFMPIKQDSDQDQDTAQQVLRDPRDCPETENPNYYEVHMQVRLPIFQQGDAPYETKGGGIALERGKPKLQRKEAVCLAITIPKNKQMPDTGWPVMIYAHGTNGSFRSGPKLLGNGLSTLEDRDGKTATTAIVAIDQVMHGSRLGEGNENLSPGPLFFNVKNPIAAKGNLIQGAIDHFALLRWLQNVSQTPIIVPNAPEVGNIKFNLDYLSYHGHSQGGTVGPLFAPYADQIDGFAFSGTAGGLIFSLLGKKSPYDSTIGLRLVLQELTIEENHPALHLFQEYFDEVDPLNYGHLIFKDSIGIPAHFLQIMGLQDTYTPESGQRSYTASTGSVLALPSQLPNGFDRIEDLDMTAQTYPQQGFQGNYNIQTGFQVTAVTVQYQPDMENGMKTYDGHFVTYKNRTANQQLLNFIGDLSVGLIPSILETP